MFLDSKAPWSDIDLRYIMLQWSCRFWIYPAVLETPQDAITASLARKKNMKY
jgi:hypothetical protein